MSALTAVVRIGARPPLGGGIEPSHVAHCYGVEWPRFVVYEVRSGGDRGTKWGTNGRTGPALRRLPGAYAPAFESDPSYPLTDLLLATSVEKSTVGDRIEVLDTKAAANYGTSFREKVLEGDVTRGSPAYGRLFEARSQLEAHPYEGALVVGLQAGLAPRARTAIRDNAARLDADVEVLDATSTRRTER